MPPIAGGTLEVPFCASCVRRLTVVRSRRSVVPFGAEIADSVVESADKDRGDRAGFLALDDQLAGIRWRLL